jgi:hypothetical protein
MRFKQTYFNKLYAIRAHASESRIPQFLCVENEHLFDRYQCCSRMLNAGRDAQQTDKLLLGLAGGMEISNFIACLRK